MLHPKIQLFGGIPGLRFCTIKNFVLKEEITKVTRLYLELNENINTMYQYLWHSVKGA
jgi:hypothetical protein